MLPEKIIERDLTEFVKKYIGEDIKIQPYQEKLMESLKFENGAEIKIFKERSNDSLRVFDYFYTHWNIGNERGQNHIVGQECKGDTCPICQAVEAITDTDFIKAEEMKI